MTLLPEPLPCARPDCGKTPAAHLGFLLGHQYEEPQPERQGLERASGYPRAVDGPGCTPAALAGRQAADRARDSVLQPWERELVAMDEAGQIPVVPTTAEEQPAPPAEATAGERCQKCRRPFDQNDPSFEGLGRHPNTPFCRECITLCHDSEIADHWCAVDRWRNEEEYS